METSSFDQILVNFVGGHGKYQIINSMLVAILYHASLEIIFIHVFTAHTPTHRCKIEGCETLNQSKVIPDLFDHDWLSYTIPKEETSTNFLGEKNAFDSCKMYKRIALDPKNLQDFCSPQSFSLNETVNCQEYLFDNIYFDETLTTKLDLVCQNASYKKLLGTILILGLLFGSLIGGRIGDQFGRKKALLASSALIVPVTISAGHVSSYNAYALLHFITMFCLPIIWVNTTVYSNEMFGPKWRFLSTVLFNIPFGPYLYTLIAYLNRSWTEIHLWCGISVALILPIFLAIPESPRWLTQNNREEEAMTILRKIGKTNGRTLSNNDEVKVKKMLAEIANESTLETLTPLDVFKHGQIQKTLILYLAWIITCISFYAIGLNSSMLSGNILVNFFLARSMNFGAVLYYFFTANYSRFGRRFSLSFAYFIMGSSFLVLAFVPKNEDKVILTFYLLANMIAIATFSLVYLMTSELYPTNLRSQAVGLASTVARVFCLCAPFVGSLASLWEPLPMMIIGLPTLICSALVLKLPETVNKELPQTVQNAQELK